jgi:glycosyltransferase involved in cell wall biosynthesis
VVTAHGTDVNQALVDAGYRRRMLSAARQAERILCVSEFVRARLLSLGCSGERVLVHHLGVPIPARPGRGSGGGLRFICVAALRPEKGHLHLVRAFREVAAQVPEAELVLVGEGELRGAVASLVAESGLSGRVHLLGARTEAEVQAELARADVYVQHSVVHRTDRVLKEEGLPVSLVEAAGMGLPIVTTQVGGILEICRHGVNGLASAAGDHRAMARNMLRLAQDPGLRLSLGERGRALVVARFDQHRLLRGLEDLYAEILTGGER